MKEEIIIEIGRDGSSVEIQVKGASGRRCLDLTRPLEEALGPVTSRQMKSEGFVQKAGLRNRLTLKPTRG
jgi:hypothetical protein